MTLAAILIGAGVGAGTAAAMGGDPKKGAMYGAIGGGIGGAVGPAAAGVPVGFSQSTAAAAGTGAVVGGVTGGATARKDITGKLPTALSPIPKTVMARERAEREKLGKKKRQRATVMGGGLGELTLGKPGLLGV